MKCQVCDSEIEQFEVSQYAAYGGLPGPCCSFCFEENDYSIKSREELAGKSLRRRALWMAVHDKGTTAELKASEIVSFVSLATKAPHPITLNFLGQPNFEKAGGWFKFADNVLALIQKGGGLVLGGDR